MGNRLILLLFVSVLAVLASFVVFPLVADAEDVPRVSGEYLERKLGSEGLVIVDARSGSDWRGQFVQDQGRNSRQGREGKDLGRRPAQGC